MNCRENRYILNPSPHRPGRERGSEGASERESDGATERRSDGATERGSNGARERGRDPSVLRCVVMYCLTGGIIL